MNLGELFTCSPIGLKITYNLSLCQVTCQRILPCPSRDILQMKPRLDEWSAIGRSLLTLFDTLDVVPLHFATLYGRCPGCKKSYHIWNDGKNLVGNLNIGGRGAPYTYRFPNEWLTNGKHLPTIGRCSGAFSGCLGRTAMLAYVYIYIVILYCYLDTLLEPFRDALCFWAWGKMLASST